MYFITFQPNKRIKKESEFSEYYKFIYDEPIWCTGYTGPKQIIADAFLAGPHLPEKIIIFQTDEYKTVNTAKWNAYLGRYFVKESIKQGIKNHYKNRRIDFWKDFEDGKNHHEYIVDKKNIKPIIECTLTKNGEPYYDEDAFNKIVEICKKNSVIHNGYIESQISMYLSLIYYLYENNKTESNYEKLQYRLLVHDLFIFSILPSIMAALTNSKKIVSMRFGDSVTSYQYFFKRFNKKLEKINKKYDVNIIDISSKRIPTNEVVTGMKNRYEYLYRFIYKEIKILSHEEIKFLNDSFDRYDKYINKLDKQGEKKK